MPWSVLPHAHSTTAISVTEVFKQFLEEEVNSLRPSGGYQTMNWVIIGLDNDLSPVQSNIIILIDAHTFPFVHIRKRYIVFINM